MIHLRKLSGSALLLAKKTSAVPQFLGRVSNNLTLGVVGLANVGKSTFFQAITKSSLGNPANYPYATIDAEKALVAVESPKLDLYQKLFQSEKKVATSLTVYDIAGLTRNAASGQGLGNKFLSDIRQVDGLFHVVRGFRDEDITHIEESVDPVRDLTIVTDELILKDLDYIETAQELARKNAKKPNTDKKQAEHEMQTLEKLLEVLYSGKKVALEKWSADETGVINPLNLLTAKPTLVLLNVSEADYVAGENEFREAVEQWIEEQGAHDRMLLFSADFERKLIEDESSEGAKPSAMPDIVAAIREVLHLISFYTCGPKEAHQWTVREGATAPEAAGAIHTDLQKTFISAQVYKYADLAAEAVPLDEAGMRRRGKQLRVGKLYEIEDGDVVVVKAAKGNR